MKGLPEVSYFFLAIPAFFFIKKKQIPLPCFWTDKVVFSWQRDQRFFKYRGGMFVWSWEAQNLYHEPNEILIFVRDNSRYFGILEKSNTAAAFLDRQTKLYFTDSASAPHDFSKIDGGVFVWSWEAQNLCQEPNGILLFVRDNSRYFGILEKSKPLLRFWTDKVVFFRQRECIARSLKNRGGPKWRTNK